MLVQSGTDEFGEKGLFFCGRSMCNENPEMQRRSVVMNTELVTHVTNTFKSYLLDLANPAIQSPSARHHQNL